MKYRLKNKFKRTKLTKKKWEFPAILKKKILKKSHDSQ